MPAYGNNPTSLGHLSNHELFSMYRGESWSAMKENARLELLQETVNRSAAANGEIGSCKVSFSKDLPHYVAGVQSGDEIQLNYDMFVNDTEKVNYNGHVIDRAVTDSNMKALETVLHEDIHAWQNQCTDGTIKCNNEALLREYASNNGDLSVIDKPDGTVAVGQQYMRGEGYNGYYMYYLQSSERDAHKFSEERTMQIMDYLESQYGTEPSFQAYRQDVAENGYNAVLEQAKIAMNNEFVEEDINTTLMNQYYGTNDPVHSRETEEAVKQEMVLSFEKTLQEQQENGTVMDMKSPETENGHTNDPNDIPPGTANKTEESVGESIGETTEETTEESVGETTEESIGETTEESIGESIEDSVNSGVDEGTDDGIDSNTDGGIGGDDGGIE